MNKLFEYIKRLIEQKFYGELRIKFHAGKIVHIEEIKSFSTEQFQD
jgi:hypothetical protein